MEEEYLDVVNEKDQFVRKATRKEVREKALLHRVARLIIEKYKGELLVQKRSMKKDIYPGYWDIGAAETVKSGQSYEGAAMVGLRDELGITGISNIQLMHSLLFKIIYNSPKHNVLCKVYKLLYNGKFNFLDEEVDEVKLLTTEQITDLTQKESFDPVGALVFKKYLDIKNKINK